MMPRLVLALVALMTVAGALVGSRRFFRDVEGAATAPEFPGSRRGPALVIALGLLLHTWVFAAFPPLLQFDSSVYLFDAYFRVEPAPPHYPPIYCLLVRGLASRPSAPAGLVAITALQHALAIGVALVVERLVRSTTGTPWIAGLAGVVVATDGHLALYAQSIMSEVPAIAFVLASTLCLVEGSLVGAPGAARRLALAGLLSGLATLTRMAFEGWFAAAAVWILVAGAYRPRARAAILFAAVSLACLGPAITHNYALWGRVTLTAATGRNLVYRAVHGVPRLTDPDAPPGDVWERARALVWAERERCWTGPYHALKDELGWSDAEVDRAFVRFYFEQVRRHPAPFARTTLVHMWELLRAREPYAAATAIHDHDRVQASAPERWTAAPFAGEVPAVVAVIDELALSTRLGVLALALLSPLVARGAARQLALLALLSIAYFVGTAALVELPVARYRLPAMPFIVLAMAVGLDALSRPRCAR